MERNLGLTKGLYFSQTILLKLTEPARERKTAYEAVQRAAMRTWQGRQQSFAENAKEEPEITRIDFARRKSMRSARSRFISATSTKRSAPWGCRRTFCETREDALPRVQDPRRLRLFWCHHSCASRSAPAISPSPMPKPFYITTAIDYTNGAPHIGHAYEKVLADVIARYHRLKGEEVFFLTGVDQHGQKVQQSAEKAGVAPQQFVDEITAKFIALWEKLEVRYDAGQRRPTPCTRNVCRECCSVSTTKSRLQRQTGGLLQRPPGAIPDRQRARSRWRVRSRMGRGRASRGRELLLPARPVQRLAARLFEVEQHPDCVTPAFRQTELINAVEKLSGDLCISRPKSRLSWGIELPFDPEYVNFVWFDALTNYISFIGYDPAAKDFSAQPAAFREKWPALHIIGKDILIPAHGIYWPIMLHALGFPDEQMPKFLVHGWWNISGTKMSKSLGNVIDPDLLAEKYGAEALRYYLMSDMVIGQDADFLEFRIIERHDGDLANSLGNLLNRTLNMAARYSAGSLRRGNGSNAQDSARMLCKHIAISLRTSL